MRSPASWSKRPSAHLARLQGRLAAILLAGDEVPSTFGLVRCPFARKKTAAKVARNMLGWLRRRQVPGRLGDVGQTVPKAALSSTAFFPSREPLHVSGAATVSASVLNSIDSGSRAEFCTNHCWHKFNNGRSDSSQWTVTFRCSWEQSSVQRRCVDKYGDFCARESKKGECYRNPGWMFHFCSKSCNACDQRDTRVRCTRKNLNLTETPAWSDPGASVQSYVFLFLTPS